MFFRKLLTLALVTTLICCSIGVVLASDMLSKLALFSQVQLEKIVIDIARASLEDAVLGTKTIDVVLKKYENDDIYKELLKSSAGVFVTVVKNNAVRACVGSVWTKTGNIVEEIIYTATNTSTFDRRKPPITPNELANLEYAVSIVGRLESVNPKGEWSPIIYGLFVRKGTKSGIILPGEAKTHAKQLSWACEEAGIDPMGQYEAYRFQTVKVGCRLDLR